MGKAEGDFSNVHIVNSIENGGRVPLLVVNGACSMVSSAHSNRRTLKRSEVGLLRGLYLNKPKMFLARSFRVTGFVTPFSSESPIQAPQKYVLKKNSRPSVRPAVRLFWGEFAETAPAP